MLELYLMWHPDLRTMVCNQFLCVKACKTHLVSLCSSSRPGLKVINSLPCFKILCMKEYTPELTSKRQSSFR